MNAFTDLVVIGLGPELRRERFWYGAKNTFMNPMALFREAVARSFSPSLSVISVATCAARHGYSVRAIDLCLEYGIPFVEAEHDARYSQLRRDITELAPRAVLISCPTAREHLTLLRVAAVVRACDPSCVIVVGGYHPTSMPACLLETGLIDVVVRGDFEPIASELLSKATARRVDLLAQPSEHLRAYRRQNHTYSLADLPASSNGIIVRLLACPEIPPLVRRACDGC